MNQYNQLVEQALALITRDANACVNFGVDRQLDELPDPSLSEIRAAERAARQLLEAADACEGELSFEQEIDVALIRLIARQHLQRYGQQLNNGPELCQKPQAGEGISSGIFLLFANDPRPAKERLINIHRRIEGIPKYLERMLERLDKPVQRWVDIDIDTIEGLDELFDTIGRWAQDQGYSEVKSLNDAIGRAKTSLGDYVLRLGAMPTNSNIAIGRVAAQHCVSNSGIELSLDEIHQVAVDFFVRTRAEIEALRVKLCKKYQLSDTMSVADLQAWLNKKYAVALVDGDLNAIITRYREEHQRILAFNRQRKLFPIFEDQDLSIIRTPGFMAPMIPAGAMMPPPPLREGTRRSMVYLTLSEALLDEHTELGIPLMMIHEGIPGHHLQLASSSRHPSVIRRIFPAMELAEGWTTMLEDYMLDQGYMGELTDEARFGAKLDISRIGARVAIDLYFMTGERDYLQVGFDIDTSSDDVFVNAGRLLKAVTGFTDARVEGELNWYSQERGYPLSYLVGNHLVWQLKKDFIAAHKDQMADHDMDRLFHQVFIESGCMPVAKLRRVFEQRGLL